ncbi:MAG: MBL fold metallo-hydrolase [Bdellovibrionales bacterium]|nr:MBL fold metallo-hydrolase [Bdellovibrionales bacterium]
MKIITVDCNYVESEFASAYLLVSQGRGFFIECNTNYAIPRLQAAVAEAGLKATDVDGLCVTHVHLDHAGGAGLFLKEFPSAKLYAHPRAAKHAIDPSRLVASATQVYGQAFMDKLYGKILPCPVERVVALEDGQEIDWMGGKLETKHTRGHANHHLCVFEPETRTLFTGDSFGVSYPKINRKRGLIVLASTSPTDFDGEAAIATVDWVEALKPIAVGPTHFGLMQGKDVPTAARQLRDQIRFSVEMVKRIKRESLDEVTVTEHIHDWMIQYYANRGINFDSEDLKILKLDFQVNAQGLVFTAAKPA